MMNNQLFNDEIKNNKQKTNWSLRLAAYFIILVWLFGFSSLASAKEYDGIWFMGYNLKNEVLAKPRVREAVDNAIDKEFIVKDIVSKEVVPESIVPPTMIGFDAELEPTTRDVGHAKLLMQAAGYPINDQRLKNFTLLHTDGVKTKAIAQKLQQDLSKIGMKVNLVEVNYLDQKKWVEGLSSGKYDFFLMGYKAGIEEFFVTPEAGQIDSYSLIEPLFSSRGSANFTGYSSKQVDKLLDQLSGINLALKAERHAKLKEINQILVKARPVEVLFYIEKI